MKTLLHGGKVVSENGILKRDILISGEKIEKIFESVLMAPTIHELQNQKFVIVEEDKIKKKLYKAANEQEFIENAPVVVVGITKTPKSVTSSGIRAGVLNVTIAMDHLSLKATEEGLGTCWVSSFIQEKVKRAINVPEEYEIIALMTLGYQKSSLEKKERKKVSLEKSISYNEFSY